MSSRRKTTIPKRLQPSTDNECVQFGQSSGEALRLSSGDLIIDDFEDDAPPAPSFPKKRKSKGGKSPSDVELEQILDNYSCVLQVDHPDEHRNAERSLFCIGRVDLTAQSTLEMGDGMLESVLRNSRKLFIACKNEQADCHIVYNLNDQWLLLSGTMPIAEELRLILSYRRCAWLILAEVVDTHIVLDVVLPPSSVYRLSHPSDSPRNYANCEMQTLVHHFLGITHTARQLETHQLQRQDFDLLYTRVAAAQSSQATTGEDDVLCGADVQHPMLNVTLRPYQREVVKWMLRRELQPQSVVTVDNFLYSQLVDRHGKVLYYNKYGGFFVGEKIDFALTARPGGILADEMGLGKTVEFLACILHHPMPSFDPASAEASDTDEYELSDGDDPMAEDLADLPQGTRVQCLCGGLALGTAVEEVVRCPCCRAYYHLECTASGGLAPGAKYLCPHCWVDPAKEKMRVKTTLIVSPSSISFQWLEEIERHQKDWGLHIMEYKGVQSDGFVSPLTFARYDVVLTTYEVLRKEANFTDLPHSSNADTRLRKPRKFQHPPCPLTALHWWRLCLDEAQMVEATTTRAAQMALKLTAVNRWCVTGTPIQRSLHDLYGLLLFLGEEPYDVKLWWSECLLLPYCCGDTEPLVSVLSRCFKRTMKRNVLDQIGVPPQESVFHPLQFCAVEEVFYQRQADQCASLFMEQIRKFPDHNARIEKLDRHSVALLLRPLVQLRQACCHPRAVRGAFLAMKTESLTMEQLLTHLIKKTKVECEEAHRRMVLAMNGMAGILIIREEFKEAADTYRQVLWSARDHSKDIKTDRLQQLHALHNLAQLLDVRQPPRKAIEASSTADSPASGSGCATLDGEQTDQSDLSQSDALPGVDFARDAVSESAQSAENGNPTVEAEGAQGAGSRNSRAEAEESAQSADSSTFTIEAEECAESTGRSNTTMEAGESAGSAQNAQSAGSSNPAVEADESAQNAGCSTPAEEAEESVQSAGYSDLSNVIPDIYDAILSYGPANEVARASIGDGSSDPSNRTLDCDKNSGRCDHKSAASGSTKAVCDLVDVSLNSVMDTGNRGSMTDAVPQGGTLQTRIEAARKPAEVMKPAVGKRKVCYIPQAPSDDRLLEEAAKLRESYLEGYLTPIHSAREQFSQASQSVEGIMKKFSLSKVRPWWSALLDASLQKSRDEWLVARVKDDLEAKKSSVKGSSLSDKFSNAHGLQYVVATRLAQLEASRKDLQSSVRGLSAKPSAEEVMSAIECHLRPSKKKREKCLYCIVHEMFNMYENHLFCFTEDASHEEAQDREEAVFGSLRRGNWGESEVEKIIKSLSKNSFIGGDETLCADGQVHVQLFTALKKEFRAMRAVHMNITDFVGALDELEMATVRLEVQAPKPSEEKDATPLPVNVLRPWEVPEQWEKFRFEKELYKNDLKKKLGQLFYLQNLEKAGSHKNGESNPEPCPICCSALGTRWSVMLCGHSFCLECIRIICNTPSHSRNGKLLCAICRRDCAAGDIFYVDTNSPQAQQSRFAIKGSHSTKVGGILETVLEIKADDPNAKILMFSNWPVVLEVLRRALEENEVSCSLLKTGSTFENNLALFRHDPSITVLLLPLRLGAKGLNLIEATHVFLVEPILNLGDELQAIGRVHRIGQTRKTYVHRFMVKNTIEERIVDFLKSSQTSQSELQDHEKMTINDLKDLFK
ncbi:E3 ubiquitin-protein ligase SHPRH isoform X1 [Amblyomma americanum]